MTTIRDFESIWLDASVSFESWKNKFLADFYAPVGREMLRMMMETLTEEQKRQLKEENPEEYDKMMKELRMEV